MSFKMYILPTLADNCRVARTRTSFSWVLNLTPSANVRIDTNKTDIERSKIQTWKIPSSDGIYISANLTKI